jgi:hypothetical protein
MAGQQQIADGNFVQRVMYLGSDRYDAGTLSVANGQTAFDAKADAGTTLWATVPKAYYTEIRTDKAITVYLNASTNAGIYIAAADSPYIIDHIATTNVYIANASGAAAAVSIVLA